MVEVHTPLRPDGKGNISHFEPGHKLHGLAPWIRASRDGEFFLLIPVNQIPNIVRDLIREKSSLTAAAMDTVARIVQRGSCVISFGMESTMIFLLFFLSNYESI